MNLNEFIMARKVCTSIFYLILCCILDSSRNRKILAAETSTSYKEVQKNNNLKSIYQDVANPRLESASMKPCQSNCFGSKIQFHAADSSIDVLHYSDYSAKSPTTTNTIISEQSEKITYSKKYSPEIGSNHDGFVPVPGPYGKKSSQRKDGSKPALASTNRAGPIPKNVNSAVRNARNKEFKNPVKINQNVQRRVQYRNPNINEELTMKESISNENMLGNGNFEILRGGIFSDRNTNEIIGSRRISRGHSSHVMPTYRQNRFSAAQNIQLPPFYHRHTHNSMQPIYYHRAPY